MEQMTEQAESAANQRTHGRVAVIYHYFAHYREPVNLELIRHGEFFYEFFGDTHSFDSGIEITDNFPDRRFQRLRGWQLGPLFLQPGALRIALSPQYKALILLGNMKWPTMWLTAMLGRMTGKKVFFWTHGWLAPERGLKKRLRNLFYQLGNGLLLYGHRAKRIGVEHMGFDPRTLHVIYNSLDTATQTRVRDSITETEIRERRGALFPGRSHLPTLINVSRLLPTRQLDLLIQAAYRLEQQGKPVNLLIAGGGPLRCELEELARQLKVTANFLGPVYDERELGLLFLSADLTVMPGPIGLLVMHSLAYGTPVLSNDDFDNQMPEIEAIRPGRTGDSFKAGDVDSLANTIENWLTRAIDPNEQKRLAREVIEKYYNPSTQRRLIDRALRGEISDDLDFDAFRTA